MLLDRLCSFNCIIPCYAKLQIGLTNSLHAWVCSFSFCSENSHQSFLFCPLCIALSSQWCFSHKMNGYGAPTSGTCKPADAMFHRQSRQDAPHCSPKSLDRKRSATSIFSLPGYACWKDFFTCRLNCHPKPHQFWANFNQCFVNDKLRDLLFLWRRPLWFVFLNPVPDGNMF